MSAYVIRQALDDRIDAEIKSMTEGLISAKAADYADYKARCARIKAMHDVKGWVTDAIKGMGADVRKAG